MEDKRGTYPAARSPSLCYAPRDDLAGTCKVMPSPLSGGPLGLIRRTGRIKEARHSDEIKGDVEKKKENKKSNWELPVETDSWETGTSPRPWIPERTAWGRPGGKPRSRLGATRADRGRNAGQPQAENAAVWHDILPGSVTRPGGWALRFVGRPVTRPLVSATFVPVTPDSERPGALGLRQKGRCPDPQGHDITGRPLCNQRRSMLVAKREAR